MIYSKYQLIIDAIYGIGLHARVGCRRLKLFKKLISILFVLSLDAPSGLNPFSGKVFGEAIHADCTLTLSVTKPGLHTGDGLDCSGEVHGRIS